MEFCRCLFGGAPWFQLVGRAIDLDVHRVFSRDFFSGKSVQEIDGGMQCKPALHHMDLFQQTFLHKLQGPLAQALGLQEEVYI